MKIPSRFRRSLLAATLAAALLPMAPMGATGEGYPQVDPAAFVTSARCAACHQPAYRGWQKTFHATVIGDAEKDPSVIRGDLDDPTLPFKASDIKYAVGGHWDQRYLARIDNDYYVLPRTWAIQGQSWTRAGEWGWKTRPYSRYCVGCHSVGFDPGTKTYVEHAVGCEACHGPGATHAADPKGGNIVNPKRLSRERSDEVCAACHVRGTDVSGDFYFPVGYTAGLSLGDFLVPDRKKKGESNSAAIARLWAEWRTTWEANGRSKCVLCEIGPKGKPGETVDGKGKSKAKVAEKRGKVDIFCLGCHEFGGRVARHTHHRKGIFVRCTDCHRTRDRDGAAAGTKEEPRSHGCSMVHDEKCWDPEVHEACLKCHAKKGAKWARRTTDSWRKPVRLDH